MLVHDVDRPDVNGTPPKMQAVCAKVAEALEGIAPVLSIKTDDNLMSSVTIRGSLDERETWAYGIYENSRHFLFLILPPRGRRYYDEAEPKITVELVGANYKLRDANGFRKGTTTLDKAIARIKKWIEQSKLTNGE